MPHDSASPTTRALDAHRGSLTAHRRYVLSGAVPVLIDHVLSSRGGAYLIQERPDTRDVDDVRHLAERLESAVSRPIDPVLVVADPAVVDHTVVRGVIVLAQTTFAAWLAGLPETTTRSEMVLIHARVEKATGDWDHHRRIPDWEVRSRLDEGGILAAAPAAARRPMGGPGPRAWSPADPSGRPGAARPGAQRAVMTVMAVVLVLAVLGLLLGH